MTTRRGWVSWLAPGTAVLGLTLALSAWVSAQEDNAPAKKAACLSNLKQLSLGMLMYTQDYDETFPPAGKWSTVIEPYVKNRSIYSCPADSKGNSYAMSHLLSGVKTKRVSQPLKTVMFFESDLHRPNASGMLPAAAVARHMGGSHFAFADGHVTWLKTPPPFGTLRPGRLPGR